MEAITTVSVDNVVLVLGERNVTGICRDVFGGWAAIHGTGDAIPSDLYGELRNELRECGIADFSESSDWRRFLVGKWKRLADNRKSSDRAAEVPGRRAACLAAAGTWGAPPPVFYRAW